MKSQIIIKRNLAEVIRPRLFQGKAIIVFGPRQVGKTTLMTEILKTLSQPYAYFNGDEADVRSQLSHTTSTQLRQLIHPHKVVFIDEAQRIPDIGLTLKLIIDQLKDVQVLATGSSAFELNNRTNEPLTGRKYEFLLFPFSFNEMVNTHGLLEEKRHLERRLIYGYYPDVVQSTPDAKEILKLLTNSYLYKDLLLLDQIHKSAVLENIVKALALQVGSEVNYAEIAQLVRVHPHTVEKYICLLEQAYIVFHLNAWNKNVRNEIKKGKKIYFYDNGIRNAVLSNFNTINNRTDIGALWENFLISERKKYLNQIQSDAACYFWRTTQQQEIDYLEVSNDQFSAYEFKWNPRKKPRFPKTFLSHYPVTHTAVITPEQVQDFL